MKRRLLGLLLLFAGCIGPAGWDGRTDGGRLPADEFTKPCGQPGVTDLRSGRQNDLCLTFP